MKEKNPHTQSVEAEESVKQENQFSKDQLLASNRFRERRDIVNALLSPGETYTVNDVERKINQYMKGKVK